MSVALGLAVGTGLGAISGWLVSRVKLPPFIVTLGMWQIVLAANYLYSANETLRSQDIAEQAAFLQFLGTKIKFGGATFTFGVVLMVALVIILAYALRSTAWGRHVYAVGDDPEAFVTASQQRSPLWRARPVTCSSQRADNIHLWSTVYTGG